MLKRQRPVTPPPSFLGDFPPFLSDGPARSSCTSAPSQPRLKRPRTQPPPLDGLLRGWPETGPHSESDGEEDWIEDTRGVLKSSPPLTMADQYKDTNSLLHELHVLNQHRLLFSYPPQDRRLNSVHRTRDSPVGEGPVTHTDGSPYPRALDRDKSANQSCCTQPAEDKGLAEEVQYVRQRYEDANRLLGSLFLSRRREIRPQP